jgi:hypothetical protein
VLTIRGAEAAPFLDSPQASLLHQACHPMFATADLLGSQFGMYTWTAIDLSALQESLSNLLS